MKIIQTTNKEFLIWSMLNGDHALIDNIKLLNSSLIEDPNFSCQIQNKLRETVFDSKRKYISEFMKNSSITFAKFSFEELMSFESCFSNISFETFLDNYKLSISKNKGFKIIRKNKEDIEKSIDAIEDIRKRMKSLESWFEINEVKLPKTKEITSQKILNSKNIWVATNRLVVCKTSTGTYKIIDGTHRLLSYGLLKSKNNLELKNLYGFYFEEQKDK